MVTGTVLRRRVRKFICSKGQAIREDGKGRYQRGQKEGRKVGEKGQSLYVEIKRARKKRKKISIMD